jgi:hypothetical protein
LVPAKRSGVVREFCCAHCARSSGMERGEEIRDTTGAQRT